MLEVLQFIFSGFWTWLGCCILVACFKPLGFKVRIGKKKESPK